MLAIAIEHLGNGREPPGSRDPPPEVVIFVRAVLGAVSARLLDRLAPQCDRAVGERIPKQEPARKLLVPGREDDPAPLTPFRVDHGEPAADEADLRSGLE